VAWLVQRAGQLSRSLLSVRVGSGDGTTAQAIAKKSGRGVGMVTPPSRKISVSQAGVDTWDGG